MKKLIWLLLFSTIVLSCCTNGGTSTNAIVRGNTMINKIDTIVSISYADTICMNESIPYTLSSWITNSYRTNEGKIISKYMYIKKMDSLQTVYVLMIDSIKNKAHFVKRITFNKK